jgi:hypothetical protein
MAVEKDFYNKRSFEKLETKKMKGKLYEKYNVNRIERLNKI